MLSPYFPAWITVALSPLVALIGPKLPAHLKPVVLFLLSVGVTIAVIVATPLDWPELIAQAIILYGTVVTGYTIAKSPIKKPDVIKSIGLMAGIAILFIAGMAFAQDSLQVVTDTLPPAPELLTVPIVEPVKETANVWLQWGLGFLGGVLARFIGKVRG